MKITTKFICLAIIVYASQAFSADTSVKVQDLADKWVTAYNAHDKKALGKVYTQDAQLYLHGSPRIVGRPDIEKYWERDFDEQNPLTLLTVTHSVDGYDMKLVHGNYQVVDRASGRQLGFGRFAHIWLMQKDGSWALDRDLWNQPYDASTP